MILCVLALLISLLLPCSAARAVEVIFGAEGKTGYNSNVFYQPTDLTGAGFSRIGPSIALQDRTGQLTWNLRYRPSYEILYPARGIDSAYQLADGEIVWNPSPATQIYANDTFSLAPVRASTSETDQATLLAQPTPIFSNSLVMQNLVKAGILHAFDPRWVADLSFSSSVLDYQSSRYSDSAATSAQAYATYALYPTDQVGTGLGATRQTISSPGSTSSGSNYYQLFGIWNHEFSPTWSMKLNAGPTLVQPDAVDFSTTRPDALLYSRNVLTRNRGTVLSPLSSDGCVPFDGVLVAERCPNLGGSNNPIDAEGVVVEDAAGQPIDFSQTGTLTQIGAMPDSAGSSITYFANLSVTKRWRWFETTGTYVRNASNTSGFSQSLVTDTLTLTNVWDPSPVWRLVVVGLYTHRASSSKQTVLLTPVSPIDFFRENSVPPEFLFTGVQAQGLQIFTVKSGLVITNYSLSAQLNRKVARNSYVYGRASYEKQVTSRTGLASTDVDRYQVTVGFRYEFDPIHVLN